MPVIEWDRVEDRVYETGLDRGVLYLPDGTAVPWNGLTSVIENFDKEVNAVYYDGMKIQDVVTLGDFSATMKAVTFPDEFLELEGLGEVKHGVFYADQMPKPFGLCYRTRIGNPIEGDEAGYKIHVLYNVTAIPSAKTYATLAQDPSLVEFEWSLTAVPEEIPGFRPTAHIIIDSRDVDPWLWEELEQILYGTALVNASLIPMAQLTSLINNWFRVKITDNGDGTWTATAERDGFIQQAEGSDYFEIVSINAVYLDEETYILSDTSGEQDVPQISVNYTSDTDYYIVSTDHDNLIEVAPDGKSFEIRNANVVFQSAEWWQITDTTAED